MSFGNFGGTLFLEDKELCEFKYNNGLFVPESLVIFDTDCFYCPLPLKDYSDVKGWDIFLESRLTAEWRRDFLMDLSQTPIDEYNPEQLLRYTKSRVMTDKYWVQEDFDMRCWSAAQLDILYSIGKLFCISEERL